MSGAPAPGARSTAPRAEREEDCRPDVETRAGPEDHSALRLWLRLLATTNLIEGRVRRLLQAKFATTLPRFDLMSQLYRMPDGLKMGELSQRMMVTGGNVTGIVDLLERESLRRPLGRPGRRQGLARAPHGRRAQGLPAHGREPRALDRPNRFPGSSARICAISRSCSAASRRPSGPRRAPSLEPPEHHPETRSRRAGMSARLTQFAQDVAAGRLRVVDLTQTLSPEFPALQLPPQFGQVWAFKMERISQYDDAGPGWYWNNFSCGEHTGTHFDAPVHWISGRELPNNAVDTIAPQNFLGAAVVVDASAEVAANPDWLLTVEFLQAWEKEHGRIPAGAWVLFRTDWSKRMSDPASFVNMREDGPHTPGPSQPAVEWLIRERDVRGFGVETINTDAGQSHSWPMPYPCHTLMHGANRFGLQCLKNLDQLPAQGAVIVAAPLKIQGGSGSPLRVLALVEE